MGFEKEEDDWRALLELFAEVGTVAMMDELLHLFLTISERDYLVDRYRIIRSLLTSDLTQREIAEKEGVSVAKITAGSNELKRRSPEIKQLFTEFIKERRKTEG